MAITVTIKPPEGLQAKIDALRATQARFATQVSQVVRDSAISVAANAKNYVPVSTGALRRSIRAIFVSSGLSAVIGSWLPYAARQEFDAMLNHTVRPPRHRQKNTKAGRKGSIIKGTGQFNPNAQVGFLRRGLTEEKSTFLANLKVLVRAFGEAWER